MAPAFATSSVHRGDDPELDVFAAERYFNGDDDAPWCATRSSSSLSSAFRTATHDHDRSVPTPMAATTSSEASWNSRSALLPLGNAVAAIVPDVETKNPGSGTASEHTAERKPHPSSHLGRWLLGLAGCACRSGDGEESSALEEADNVAGGKENTTEAAEPFRRTESKERGSEEAATVSVPGRWLDEMAGTAAFSPVQFTGDGHRRAASSGEISWPVLNPATTATTSDEQRRKSLQTFRPMGGQGTTLGSATQDSAFTIVAGGGNPAACRMPHSSGQRSSGEDEAAALSELECAYPPSEASVVWSVATAEGAASCNFSSAASGYYYYYFNDRKDGASRHAAGKSGRRRRSRMTNGGGFLTCVGEKAVDAVGPLSVQPAGGPAGRCGNADSCRNVR